MTKEQLVALHNALTEFDEVIKFNAVSNGKNDITEAIAQVQEEIEKFVNNFN